MARRKYESDEYNPRIKQYKEADLVMLFNLNRIVTYKTSLMQEWLDVAIPKLDIFEQHTFDKKLEEAQINISGWSEEDLKMKFIAYIVDLGNLTAGNGIVTYFDKTISATVEGTKLTVKSDFMMAKGFLDVFTTPYFHFQEYKPQKNPTGDPMAQILEAFLIAQVENQKEGSENPLYGCEIVGATWRFITMEQKTYCVSKSFDCSDDEDLLKIIAILRKFKMILETQLLI